MLSKTGMVFVFVGVFAVCLFQMVGYGGAVANQHQVGWEYKVWNTSPVVSQHGFDKSAALEDVESQLNALGEDGWEYCDNTNGTVVLKRPKR